MRMLVTSPPCSVETETSLQNGERSLFRLARAAESVWYPQISARLNQLVVRLLPRSAVWSVSWVSRTRRRNRGILA